AGGPELTPVSGSGGAVAGLPEIRSARLIRHARNHAALLAALDFPERVDSGDEIFHRGCFRTRFEPHVRHPLEWYRRPGIGLAAAVRFLIAHQVRLFARGLVVAENAFVDDGELAGLDTVVVVAAGAEAA